jgi:hypothetical protein
LVNFLNTLYAARHRAKIKIPAHLLADAREGFIIAWSKLIKFRTKPPAPQHHRRGGDQERGNRFACHQKLQLDCHPDRVATMPLPQPPRIPHLGRDNMMQCSFSAGKPARFQI